MFNASVRHSGCLSFSFWTQVDFLKQKSDWLVWCDMMSKHPQICISALSGKLCLQIPRRPQCVLLRNNSTTDRFGPWQWKEIYELHTLCGSEYPGWNLLFVFRGVLCFVCRNHLLMRFLYFNIDPVMNIYWIPVISHLMCPSHFSGLIWSCRTSFTVVQNIVHKRTVCVLDWIVIVFV